MHDQAFLVLWHILQGHKQHFLAAEASGDHRGSWTVSLDIAVLVLRLLFSLSVCSMCVTSVCCYMTLCRLTVEDWWVFLLQNSDLSVEEGKMKESWSSVNWCNIDFRGLIFFYILRVTRPRVECCHVLLTWNQERWILRAARVFLFSHHVSSCTWEALKQLGYLVDQSERGNVISFYGCMRKASIY